MNENFINTWIPNSELGRVPSLQDPIAKRRERESKTFDTTHALAQAIMKGWKKGSPADSLVISPEFELMGRLPVNERISPYNGAEGYLLFLQESLDKKLPGLGEESSEPKPTDWDALLENAVESGAVVTDGLKAVLTGEHPKQEVLSVFRKPDYTVVEIDTTAFKEGGVLTIDVWIGDAEVAGSFDLFAVNTTELVSDNALATVKDIPTNQREVIKYPFDRGGIFKLGAIASAKGNGKINGFLAEISVEPVSGKNEGN